VGAAGSGSRSAEAPWERYLRALEVFGMRPGLERVEALLSRLGDPQRAFRAVHVVGTNGKSSTTRYCAAVIGAHGLRSGAYLSPHITGFAERVVVDGRPLSDERFGAAVTAVEAAAAALPGALGPVTQFEVLTVAALLAFRDAGVEAAAVEAGLGGRLDATNVLPPGIVALTSIGLEHTEVLGDTREAIFAEKAAVIKGGAAVFGPLDVLEPAARALCRERGARALFVGTEVKVAGTPSRFAVTVEGREYGGLCLPTPAGYQTVNAAVAVAACHLLLGGLDDEMLRRALRKAAVPGRLQVVGEMPLVLADGAHNPDGVHALVASLAAIDRPAPRVAVLAILRDKGVDEMLAELTPQFDSIVCTACSEARSLTAAELSAAVTRVRPAGVPVRRRSDPRRAIDLARELAGPEGSIVVTGSLYLLADLAGLVLQAG
jgi:dihydrofolate synthase / folylpolyglutamate synthase